MKSWMEISAAAMAANLRAVQAVATAESGLPVEVLAVVKANGYGHRAEVVAEMLVEAGAGWLGVTDVEEGIAVRQAVGPKPRIMTMCAMEPQDATAITAHDLTPVVWTPAHLEALEAAGTAAGRVVRVHVEIDTGMARQGTAVGAELDALLGRFSALRWVVCEGVLSHLACAEVAQSAVTSAQRDLFAEALEQVRKAGVRPAFVHLGNSSAVDESSTARWLAEAARSLGAQPMVRTGFALYGHVLPIENGPGSLVAMLVPAMTWKTRVVGLRDIEAGATVGYGATFVATARMRLALLPVGYADGFRREASSGVGDGWVAIAGQRAKVVGRVSMNLTVVDVTQMDAVAVGDEVVLLGDGVTAEDHARWCGTIPYEVLCGVRARAMVVR